VDNVTATAASESELRWYEVLGYVGDRTPLLPLLMALAALLLVLMVCGARRAFRWHRTKIEEERSRSCRPIDSVGHKFTMGRKRFGTLPPVITDPVERMEANNLTSYTPQRGAPGAVSGGEVLGGQRFQLPQEAPPPSHIETDWVPDTTQPSEWSGPPKLVEPGAWAATELPQTQSADQPGGGSDNGDDEQSK
jgi:hypothetical protein